MNKWALGIDNTQDRRVNEIGKLTTTWRVRKYRKWRNSKIIMYPFIWSKLTWGYEYSTRKEVFPKIHMVMHAGCLERERSLTTSFGDTVRPTKNKGSLFVAHHLRFGLESARMPCKVTLKSWDKRRMKIKIGKRKGVEPLYLSLTPALIKKTKTKNKTK